MRRKYPGALPCVFDDASHLSTIDRAVRRTRAIASFLSGAMRMDYPVKILLAWGEAISGNAQLRDWLVKNGYPELGIFCFALRNKPDARDWLMKNGHPQLMAVINGIEGDEGALDWLERNGMQALKQVALTGDGDAEALKWLVANGHRELAMLGHKMHVVKRGLDDEYTDPHKFPQA